MSNKYKLYRGNDWYPLATLYEIQNHESKIASTSQLGHVLIGDNLEVDSIGKISIKNATTTSRGVVQIADDLETNDSSKALSARQGIEIVNLINNLNLSGGTESSSNVSQENIDTWNSHVANASVHITSTERSNWNNKASADIVSTSKNGLMTSDDKSKLDSIETGANNVQITDNLTSTSATTVLSARQGKVLKDTLDTKAAKKVVSIIENGLMSNSDKLKLDNISANATYTPVVNSLNSTSPSYALSAYQGKVLNEKIIALQNGTLPNTDGEVNSVIVEDNLNSSSSLNALSANQGRVLRELINAKVDEEFVDSAIQNVIDTTPTAIYVLNEISDIMQDNQALEGLMSLIGNKADKTVVDYGADGLISSSDKIKLDGLEDYANYVEVVDNLTSNKHTSALSAYQGRVLNEKFDALEDRISTIEENGNSSSTGGGLTLEDIPDATPTKRGLMTSADKIKLSTVSSGANFVQVEDSVTSTSTTSALSANKGKELYDEIEQLKIIIQNLQNQASPTDSNWSEFEF